MARARKTVAVPVSTMTRPCLRGTARAYRTYSLACSCSRIEPGSWPMKTPPTAPNRGPACSRRIATSRKRAPSADEVVRIHRQQRAAQVQVEPARLLLGVAHAGVDPGALDDRRPGGVVRAVV